MEKGHSYHRDSFGQLQNVLAGVTTWTLRALRSTKVVVPHIAKNDASYTYAGEFALLDGDVHYLSNQFGSYNELTD